MANLAEDFFELRRRWFDRWIKGLANGIDEEPSVRVFVMGGGSGRHNRDGRLDHGGYWRSAVGWPLPQTRWTRLYLHADGSLAAAPAAGSGAVDYAFDPHDPAPTVGGAISSGEPVMHGGAFDQTAVTRSDVLTFATQPLDHELEVTGPIAVRLWIASDAPDTDFTAKLIDVYPPSADFPQGFAMNLTEGLLRVRYRDSWERPAPMVPGETSTQILANRKARGSSRASPATASSPRPPDPRTSCCRSSGRASSIRFSVACPASFVAPVFEPAVAAIVEKPLHHPGSTARRISIHSGVAPGRVASSSRASAFVCVKQGITVGASPSSGWQANSRRMPLGS